MIFVSVGSQLPFERLTRAVETWAEARGCVDDIFYQIGDGTPPARGNWVRQLAPDEFEKYCREAELIVSHAGTGILIMSCTFGRQLLIFPRRYSEPGEIRNDHQMDSARRWVKNKAATVAFTVEELHSFLNDPENILVPNTESQEAKNLINAVRMFVQTGTLPES